LIEYFGDLEELLHESIGKINELPVPERKKYPQLRTMGLLEPKVHLLDKNLYDNCQLFKFVFTFKNFTTQYNSPKIHD